MEPHWTRSFATLVCSRNETVDFVELKNTGHLRVAYKSAPMAANWIANRFAGTKPPEHCPS